MQNTRQRGMYELLHGNPAIYCTHSHFSSSLTYPLERHTLRCRPTPMGKSLQSILLPIMPAYHGQAGYSTLHGVQLLYEVKAGHICYLALL